METAVGTAVGGGVGVGDGAGVLVGVGVLAGGAVGNTNGVAVGVGLAVGKPESGVGANKAIARPSPPNFSATTATARMVSGGLCSRK